ncbi:MAG: AraC-like DNA-binding protein [Crocinitomix sp.]|jgi:AraC-like DNA-binding protein
MQKDEKTSRRYIYYPNVNSSITIYKNSRVQFENGTYNALVDEDCGFFMRHSGFQTKACRIDMKSPFEKIGIVFKPLGLNHFITESLENIEKNSENGQFNFFQPSINTTIERLFETEDRAKKVQLLDDYFLSKLRIFSENNLIKAVNKIMESDKKQSVTELSAYLGINRKTLLRLFRTHIGCSAKEFITIAQFRKALTYYMLSATKPLLTDLSLSMNYYDQSEFNNQFKKITGNSPKKMLQKIKRMDCNSKLFWYVLD